MTQLKRLKKVHQKKTRESVFELIEVPKDKLDSKKLKISRSKTLSTTISTGRYALSDVNDLVKKQTAKVSAGLRLLIVTMILQKKIKKLQV